MLLSLYLLLIVAIPAELVFAPLGGAGGPATLFALVLFVFYLVAWLHPRMSLARGRQPIRLVAVLFTCSVVAAYTSVNRHAIPVLEKNAADRGLIFAFGWLGVLLLAADGIDSMDRLRTLLRRVVLGATAMAVLGMTQFFTGLNAAKYLMIPGLTALTPFTDLLNRGTLNRPSATATHPIEFGAVLAICLPLAIHQARFAPPDMRLRRWLQVSAIAVTAPMTVSRSAILGLAIGAIVILPTWPRRDRWVAYVVIPIGAVVMWLTVHGLLGTIRGLFGTIGSDSSSQSRTKAYSAAGFYIPQHPWFGRGLGTFLPQTYFYIDNQYLTSLIETGIIGLLALLALFATGWLMARAARRITADLEARDLGQSLAACSAVAAVSFATYDALSFSLASGLTFLLLGCTGAYWRLVRDASMSPNPQFGFLRRNQNQYVLQHATRNSNL
jgi:polysaccharide biosynthesis protein PslJ